MPTQKYKMSFDLNVQDKDEHWMSWWGKTIQDELELAAKSLLNMAAIIRYDRPAESLTKAEVDLLGPIVHQGILDIMNSIPPNTNETTKPKERH